jgi:hypothetical protein
VNISHHEIAGFPVTIENSRPDIHTAEVVLRLTTAIGLIDRYTPHYGRHLRRDFSGILVKRFACRGAFFPDSRLCLIELTFCVNPEIPESQMAATLLHEGMHARLRTLGLDAPAGNRAREERFCRRAEVEFGMLVPDGGPIVARALSALKLEDADVAPDIDWMLAAQRVAEVDRLAGDH